jgi:hypothetical protein
MFILSSCITIALKLRKLGGNGPHIAEKQFKQEFPFEYGFFMFTPRRDEFHVSLIFFTKNEIK